MLTAMTAELSASAKPFPRSPRASHGRGSESEPGPEDTPVREGFPHKAPNHAVRDLGGGGSVRT